MNYKCFRVIMFSFLLNKTECIHKFIGKAITIYVSNYDLTPVASKRI